MTKFASVGVAVAILMVMGAMTPLGVSLDNAEPKSLTGKYLVSASGLNRLASVGMYGADIVETYDSFTLVDADESAVAALRAAGYTVGGMLDRTNIGMCSYSFDTRNGEPAIPNDLRADDSSSLYIMQFIGPIKQSWLEDVAALGVEIHFYIPNYAYLVRADVAAIGNAQALGKVQWVGQFHPAYKIRPGLTGGDVRVTVWNGQNADETLAGISALCPDAAFSYTADNDQYETIVNTDLATCDRLADLEDVIWLENVDEIALCDEVSSEITGGIWTMNTPYGAYGNYANIQGWDGTNVVVAIADTGLSAGTIGNAGHVDFGNRVIGGIDYTGSGSWHDAGTYDGAGHGTHCAGIIAADGYDGTGTKYTTTNYYCGAGTAPDAKLYSQKIFSDAGAGAAFLSGAESGYNTFFQDAYNAGAYVHSNSWGEQTGDSAYEANDVYFDNHVRDCASTTTGQQPLVITVAAGNMGSAGTINTPASGKNVIAVGATENYMPTATDEGENSGYDDATNANNIDDIASFSSRGLDDDSRIKPDVMAPGFFILSTHSSAITGSYLYGLYDGNGVYEWCHGTSQANPNGAGCAADIVEWYNTNYGTRPMPAMVKALMINSAKDIGTADIPNGNEGWGRIYLPTIVSPPVNVMKVDGTQLLATGQTYSVPAAYQLNTQPLKVTLVYTDAADTAMTSPSLVNNLNLRVTDSAGHIWYGNSFAAGVSVYGTAAGNAAITGETWDTNTDMFDERNNVECVYIPTTGLVAGTYTIDVIAQSVTTDVITATAATIDQDFALVIYNGQTPGTTATATGPLGGPTNDNTVTITYTYSGTPTSVNIYYTKSTTSPYTWVLAANDPSVDGSYAYTIVSGSGTYSWLVSAVGGGSTEPSPPGTTIAPEASSYILDVTAPAAPSPLTVQHWGYRTTITNYTYAGVTAAAGPHNAWWYVLGTATPPSQADMNAAGTEYTDAQYTPIATSDNTRNNVARGNMNTVTQNRYEINGIAEATASMTKIDLTWEGQYSTAGTGSMYLYNFATSTWVLQGATIAFAANTEQTVTRSITAGFANYISGGTLRFLMHESARPVTAVDFVKVTISTGVGSTLLDNTLNWTHSGTDVAQYNIYCSALNTGPWDGTTLVTSVPVGTNTYSHLNKGMADATLWWYVVRAQDAAGNQETNTNAVQEPGTTAYWQNITVVMGWNLISVPYNAANTALPYSLTDQANGGAGLVQWDWAHWYKAQFESFIEPWKNFNKNWPAALNDMKNVVNTMGVWIHVTAVGDGQLCIGGSNYTRPVSTVTQLRAGWNMVGFPSDDVAYTVAMFRTDIGQPSAIVEQYDGGQLYLTSAMASATAFTPGKGYWVWVPADTIWTKPF